jgi:hypothetical protein
MRRRQIFLIAPLGLLLAVSPARAGIVVADSLSQPLGGGAPLSESVWAAQAFFSGPYTALEAVHLNLFNGNNGTFSVQLWDNSGAGGRPGSPVATLASGLPNPTTTNPDNVLSITGLNLPMNEMTTFYVVVRPDAGSTLQWGWTPSESGEGFPSAFSYTVNYGSSWSAPSMNDPQRLKVEVVPEPSVSTLGPFGFLAAWLLRKGANRLQRTRTSK